MNGISVHIRKDQRNGTACGDTEIQEEGLPAKPMAATLTFNLQPSECEDYVFLV